MKRAEMPRFLPYAELARNFLADLVSVRTESRRFLPLMTNLYLTKRCNLRCRYCYPPGDEPSLPVEQLLPLLDKIRPRNPALNLTGGEPLLYPGVVQVLQRARELKFRPLLLSTNGLRLATVVEHLGLVDHVVISLDSLSVDVNEALTGVPGSTKRIVEAIRLAGDLSRRQDFALSVHAVLAPETLSGIEPLLEFCESVGASLSVSPEHGRFDPHPALVGNPRYMVLIDRLIALKKAGRSLFCSVAYLRTIRDFTEHGCFPWLAPRVEPDGRVYFPCQRMMRRAVYLQDYPSLHELMRREAEFNLEPACAHRCYLACYLEPERYLKNPLAVLENLPLRRAMLRATPAGRTGSA